MKAARTLSAACAALAVAACATTAGGPPPASATSQVVADPTLSVAEASTAFGLALYEAAAASEDGNITLSPASISAAFAIAYPGARGETADEIAAVLRFPPENAAFREEMAAFQRALAADADGVKITLANAAWFDNKTVVEAPYMDTVTEAYSAAEHRVDFRGDPDASRETINAWVEERTEEKIIDLLSADDIKDDTRFVLVNAIYFNGKWAFPFEKDDTADGDFRSSSGQALSVRMMHQQDDFRIFEGDGFDAVSLPYEGGDYDMVIFLPRKDNGLQSFERELTSARLAAWLAALDAEDLREVDLLAPQYEARISYQLKPLLIDMGMPRAFSNAADFTAMVDPAKQPPEDELGVKLGSVVHQTFLKIDEAGTEAAAATAIVGIQVTGARIGEPPFAFHADHPFFFVIRHRDSGAILFMGRVVDPTKGPQNPLARAGIQPKSFALLAERALLARRAGALAVGAAGDRLGTRNWLEAAGGCADLPDCSARRVPRLRLDPARL